MSNNLPPTDPPVRPSRKTLRLTFQIDGGEVRLVRQERLDMITPPSVGERPEAGRHGGFWVELRDPVEGVVYHRVIDSPLGDSVEVYSPDGTIRREFGPALESFFEVLLPDRGEASTVALMGESLDSTTARRDQGVDSLEFPRGARELARFEIPKEETGDELPGGGI